MATRSRSTHHAGTFRGRSERMTRARGIGSAAVTDRSMRLQTPRGGVTLAEENMRSFLNNRTASRDYSDAPPKLNVPQRIELPVYFNTPQRVELGARKNIRVRTATGSSRTMQNFVSVDSNRKLNSQKRLKDYGMLAFACKRAGKARDEGRAYYSMGVLCDNVGKQKKAVESYMKFLQVCKQIGDTHGEALAYNCIGVDYQILAEENEKFYKDSIYYHNKHKEIADVAGKFLAHVNLGIIYAALGDNEKSSINHQFALRYAIQMSSIAGQSVAIGNLGQIGSGTIGGDYDKTRMFVERYLNLSAELKDRKGEGGAYLQLGHLSNTKGDFDNSTRLYYRAMKIAEETGDKETHSDAKCSFGVANANMRMGDHMKGILGRLDTDEHSFG